MAYGASSSGERTQPQGSTAVFVDASGRRRRRVRWLGVALAALLVSYLVLVAAALVGPPALSRFPVPGLGPVLPGPAAAPLGDGRGGARPPREALPPSTRPATTAERRPTAEAPATGGEGTTPGQPAPAPAPASGASTAPGPGATTPPAPTGGARRPTGRPSPAREQAPAPADRPANEPSGQGRPSEPPSGRDDGSETTSDGATGRPAPGDGSPS